MYVLTDTAIVGHLGTDQLAGLALASTVLLTGYAVFVFLAYGTTATVARLTGAGRPADAAAGAVQALWLAMLLGVVVLATGELLGRRMLVAMGGDGEVLENAWIYLRISMLGAPALLTGLAGTGYLRGLQNMRIPLLVTLGGVVANLIIEAVAIFVLGFDIGASALASVIAQWAVALTYLALIAKDVARLSVGLRPNTRGIGAQLRTGGDLLVRTFALRATLVVATRVAAGMGTVALAAHQIVFEVWNFLAMFLDSLAIAAQAMIGRLLGMGDPPRARFVAARMMKWAVRLGIGALVAVVTVGRPAIRIFSPDPRVVEATMTIIVIAALWQPVNSIAFTLDGILIGAGDTRFLAVSMLAATAIFVPLALLVAAFDLGLPWLWMSLGALMATRAVVLGTRLRSDQWFHRGPTT